MDLKDRRVLVTGADGFIGSHLAELLVQEGAKLRVLAQYNSFNSWGWLDGLACLGDLEVVSGDIRDPHFCYSITQDIEVIFHLAALIPIPYSYIAPDSYVDTNVTGTLNLCQAARTNGVAKFIHTSTSEVYGTAQYVPIDEKHPLNPQSPYSATKIGADSIALSFHYAFELPVIVARPFNAYGPRQSARAVIPTIICQLAQGCRAVRLGDLTTTRDFTFVEDTCRGFVELAKLSGGFGEVFHIGSNHEIAIGELLKLIAGIMGVSASAQVDHQRLRPRGSEVMRLLCDNSKLELLTGFRPAVALQEGLARTIDWFRDDANLSRYKGHLYNV
jgi:NAD dependent epimerase/dehydratase